MLIALLALPGYYYLGASFKLLLIPYVLFLMSQRSAALFPALLLHFMPGTVVSFSMLGFCAFISMLKRVELAHYKVSYLLFLACLPVPWLAGIAVINTLQPERLITETITHMSPYMCLLPFFFGILCAHDCSKLDCQRVLWVLGFAVLFQMSGVFGGSIRYVAMSYTVFFSVWLYTVIGKIPLNLPLSLLAFPPLICLGMGTSLLSASFTNFAIIAVSLSMTIGYFRFHNAASSISWSRALGLIAVLFTVYLVGYAGERVYKSSEEMNIEDVSSFADIIPAIEFKALGDRKPLWEATWATIVRDGYILPPMEPSTIAFQMAAGDDIEVSFGAHNIGLELIRNYGLLVGGIGILVYLGVFSFLGTIFRSRSDDPLLMLLGFCCISVGIIGGVFGHFVLVDRFGFLLTGLSGLVYGRVFLDSIRMTAPLPYQN